MAITLHEFGEKNRHFILDTPSGRWSVEKGSSPTSWGFASLVPQRFGLSDPVLVAVFTDGKTILFRVDNKLFDLGNADIVLQHRRAGLASKRFTVLVNGAEAFSVKYWTFAIDTFPWDSDSIFDWLMTLSANRNDLARSVFMWTAFGEGRKCDESLLAEMEVRFGSQNPSKPEPPFTRGLLCLVSYWLLFIILPAGLILSLVPKGWRIGVGVPVGFVLLLIGENGFRRWKKFWRVE